MKQTSQEQINELSKIIDATPKKIKYPAKQPNKDEIEKLLTLVGVLPVLADFMEDLNSSVFTQSLKNKCNLLIKEIRQKDELLMRGTDLTIIEQQHNIGLAFRQWHKQNFKND
jgi:hypothetical protein